MKVEVCFLNELVILVKDSTGENSANGVIFLHVFHLLYREYRGKQINHN